MKSLMMIFAVVIFTIALNTDLQAQAGKGNPTAPKTNWVDANNDGICDNAGSMMKGQCKRVNFVDANGDGVCDNNCGTNKGRRANFVDADGDGVCDNAVNPSKQRLQDGTGTGSKNGTKKRGKK